MPCIFKNLAQSMALPATNNNDPAAAKALYICARACNIMLYVSSIVSYCRVNMLNYCYTKKRRSVHPHLLFE